MADDVHYRGACVQERWPLNWAVRILLECILVMSFFFQKMVQFKVLFDFKFMTMGCHVV